MSMLLYLILFVGICLGNSKIENNTDSSATPSHLNFDEALQSRASRHLLLITLLETPNKPLSTPRFNGRISYKLPLSLKTKRADQANVTYRTQSNQHCCHLEDVPENSINGPRKPGETLQLEDLLESCSRVGVLSIERGVRISLFNNTEKQLVIKLSEILLSKDIFSHLLSVTAAVKDYVNEELFREALVMVIIRRDDVGMVLPMSSEFLPNIVISRSKENYKYNASDPENPFIDINRNEPPYQTYDPSEPEHKLWFFREDPEANSHHRYWHSIFSNPSLDRRAEFFFYMHKQMLLRYNVERLTHGLALVVPLTPDSWRKPLPLGYFPRLEAEFGTAYQGRPDNIVLANLTKLNLTLSVLEDWYIEIQKAIRNKMVITSEGNTVNLRAFRGRDEGISVLVDIVESHHSVNKELYGNLHNNGHHFIAHVTDPTGQHQTDPGVMNSASTSMRDPIFYRFHQFIDDIFTDYKASLPRYTEDELSLPGVKILSSQVETKSRINELQTLIDKGELLMPGIDNSSSIPLRVRYNRLNHLPFQYNILVNSKYARVKAMVRIFLIPQNNFYTRNTLAVEMDRYIVILNKGDNNIKRMSSQSTVTGKRQRSLFQLQEDLFSGNRTKSKLSKFEGCGWPPHLLVPKGSAIGQKFSLFVMFSRLLPKNEALSTDQEKLMKPANVFCGLRGSLVSDSRPMGFPFDRPYGRIWHKRSNMAVTNVRIFHQDS